MRRLIQTIAATALLCALTPAAASAQFGLHDLSATFTEADGSAATQAGSHPSAMSTAFYVNGVEEGGKLYADGAIRDLTVDLPSGFVGKPTATPRCSNLDFLTKLNGITEPPECANSTSVGTVKVSFFGSSPQDVEEGPLFAEPTTLYNLVPPPGVAARLGFWVNQIPVTVLLTVNPNPPYNVQAVLPNISQTLEAAWSEVTVWGNPADPTHDKERGKCLRINSSGGSASCPANVPVEPFITMPRSCTGPLETTFEAVPWWEGFYLNPIVPGTPFKGTATTPPGGIFCGKLGLNAGIKAKPTTLAASSPSGLDFSLDVHDEGLTNPTGIANADISKVVATLPEGMSANPSLAEGLEVCTQAQLARETASSEPGEGCPNAAKIGTVEVETPLLEQKVYGSLFIAKPYENPFGSLLGLYLVLQDKQLGISVKQPMRVQPNPETGQLTTIAEDLPQLPFSSFKLHFREGTRSPLATPSTCGTHTVKAKLYPSSGGSAVETTSAFQIITGPDSGPCPKGGLPPLRPGLIAGTINNAAGRYSPFNLRLHRSDAEQEITHFSIKLPPGIVGKLAGVPFCPDQAIAAAKARTGPLGGHEEQANPSCPAASEVGRTLVGAGVGPAQAYAPGKVYLAGPYNGSALSIAAITAGVVGPFDIGTVVVREGLKINPETAEVFIDATGSDPIPHIIKGIPVHLRDIRAYVDKPDFVINPTSCARTSTASTLLGAGLDFASTVDDNPITVTSPFQAADCASLGFKPKLTLKLKGSTKRGGHPALRAILRPRPGDANASRASVQLPHSAFLEQSHIRTVCTRVQFKAGAGNGTQCPAGSIYGHARAFSPILSDPLEGPVILRSSEHPLPDLVLAMHGLIDFNAVGRIDSVDGGIRNTFDFVPDAPISKVIVDLQGQKKGLIVNSTNLCKGTHRAIVKFKAHNGRALNSKPELKAQCKKAKKKNRKAAG